MNKSVIGKIIISALLAHAAALVFLAIAGMFMVNMNSTEGAPIYIGFVGIGVGTLICALLSRKSGTGVGGAFAGGFIYAGVLALISLIAGGESNMSVGMRLGVFLAAALIIGLSSLIPASSNKNTRGAIKKRRSTLSKYIDSH